MASISEVSSSSAAASKRKEEVTRDELLLFEGGWLKERVRVRRRVERVRRRRVGSRSEGCLERC